MLNVDGNDIDLSIFESGAQLPGTYYVDIMLNGKLVDTKEMEFSRERNKDGEFVLSSCLTQSMLNRYGVKVGDYPELLLIVLMVRYVVICLLFLVHSHILTFTINN